MRWQFAATGICVLFSVNSASAAEPIKTRLECYEHVGDLSRMAVSKAVPAESVAAQNARAVRMFHLCAHDKFADAEKMHDLIQSDSKIKKHLDDKKAAALAKKP